MQLHHKEHHRIHRSGWLRAAVLGANDGIVSTASLIVGVVPAIAIVMLGTLGGSAAMAGGASPWKGAWRVCFWGTLAMALTACVGKLFGISV